MRQTHIRFPGVALRSLADFQSFRAENRDLLDERYRRERSLGATTAILATDGICAICMRMTVFESSTADGEVTADGRMIPNWREQQICGCGRHANSRQRAVLHLAQPLLGSGDWARVAVLGPLQPAAHWPGVTLWPLSRRLDATGLVVFSALSASFHVVLSEEYLHEAVALDPTLAEIARVLLPGGSFLFTFPFLVDAASTSTTEALGTGRVDHQIGWDIIDRVRAAGFHDCAAYCYWSEECGYLGPYNIVFVAVR